MKKFNITGTCIPEKNYMVNIDDKLDKITHMIDEGEYFTINRARQYGKTTTLSMIDRKLSDRYVVIWMSFEGVGSAPFENDNNFVKFFIREVARVLKKIYSGDSDIIKNWSSTEKIDKNDLDAFECLGEKITQFNNDVNRPVLLMIDEIDKSSDNQIFLHFLGMLRSKYLFARSGKDTTFHSVILAGVHDIKNLKLKLRPDEEQKYNSPWNIAADFNVDMAFSPDEISSMLTEYEQDHHTGMYISLISNELYAVTNGYPYLVSCLCKWIDEEGSKIWNEENIKKATKALLGTRNTLLDDLIKNIEQYSSLQKMIMSILCEGDERVFSLADPDIELGTMFGFIYNRDGKVAISNRIFETYLYDYAINIKSKESKIKNDDKNQFVKDGKLDITKVLDKFQEFIKSEYRTEDEPFLEKQGRLLFLCFLKPIINGTGFYYIEPETRNNTRMDIVVTYGNEEHIIELKIWRGNSYREQGLLQLQEYMDARNSNIGYLLSFSFNKNKEYINGWIPSADGDKRIYEVVV